MSEKRTVKKYDETFKKTLVDLYNSGKSVRELSREYGTSEVNIHKWIRKYSPIVTSTGEVTNNDEILKLKKQLAKTQEENEILKKALAIFSRQ